MIEFWRAPSDVENSARLDAKVVLMTTTTKRRERERGTLTGKASGRKLESIGPRWTGAGECRSEFATGDGELIPSPESDGWDGWVRRDGVVGRWKGEEKGSSRKKRQYPMEVLEGVLRPSSVVQRCVNRLVHGRCRGGVWVPQ